MYENRLGVGHDGTSGQQTTKFVGHVPPASTPGLTSSVEADHNQVVDNMTPRRNAEPS